MDALDFTGIYDGEQPQQHHLAGPFGSRYGLMWLIGTRRRRSRTGHPPGVGRFRCAGGGGTASLGEEG